MTQSVYEAPTNRYIMQALGTEKPWETSVNPSIGNIPQSPDRTNQFAQHKLYNPKDEFDANFLTLIEMMREKVHDEQFRLDKISKPSLSQSGILELFKHGANK